MFCEASEGEEHDGVGDVARGRHAAQRHFLEILLAHLLGRPAALARLLAAEAVHPRAVHDPGCTALTLTL